MTRGASALPSRDASIVVPLLKKLDPPPRIAVVEEILGRRDQDVGSGVFILTFRLSGVTPRNGKNCTLRNGLVRTHRCAELSKGARLGTAGQFPHVIASQVDVLPAEWRQVSK